MNPCSPYFSISELYYQEGGFNMSHLFKIPYDIIMNVLYVLTKDVHFSYAAFNEAPWFEILMLLDQHKEFIDKQNEESENHNDMIAQTQAQMESMTRNQQQNLPKYDMPQMPNWNNIGNFGNLGNF